MTKSSPKSLPTASIDSLAIHVGSGATPRGGSEVYKEEGIIFIRSQNVTFEGLQLKEVAFIDSETHRQMSRSKIYPHDVLLNITGASIGRCCPVPEWIKEANVNQHVCAIRLPEPNHYDTSYLSHVLSSYIGQSQIDRLNAGGNREGLNYQQLRAFKIPWPEARERIRIATILDTADDTIRHTERVIAKLKQVKAGLLHDLLTCGLDARGHLRDPLAHPEQFKDSPLGRIPREWEVKRIGEISNVTKLAGFEFTNVMKYRDDGEIIALRALNIKNEELDLADIQRISRDVSDSLPRSKIHSSDILITYIGAYIGDVLLIKESNKYHLAPNIAKITAQNRVLPEFLQWVLRSEHMKSQIGQYTTVTATPSLTMTQIRGIKVVVPQNIDEQSKITSIIAAHDSRIRAEEAVLTKLRQQKQGLMADLLTGRVRVKDEG